MKEYSKNFAAYANNIEASVEKFEQAVEFSRKIKLYFKNYSYDSPVTRPDSSPA